MSEAARRIMRWLAQDEGLYGVWMDPEWREVWNCLGDIAENRGRRWTA